MSIAFGWGTEPEERSLPFPSDRLLEQAETSWYRGITIHAPPEVIFRWLCQMRVATYSYGRSSPRTLIPGLDELAIGQRVMNSFDLVDFECPRHITLRLRQDAWEARFVRDVAVSYLIVPRGADTCRLLVKVIVRHRRGALGWFTRVFVPWGDLIMMRRQLLNFQELAERTQPGPLRAAGEERHD